jgi:hypothetical protein
MKPLKHLIVTLTLLTLTTGAFAQLRLGAGMGFGFDSEAFAIFGRAAYDFSDRIRLNATYNYYFLEETIPGIDINASDLNLDLHYTFARPATISFYGLAGANLFFVGTDGKSESDFGLNLGLGGLFGIADNLDIVTEFKYIIGGSDQLFFNAGLLFSLGANE